MLAERTTTANREFSVQDEYHYNYAGPLRWIISHLFRYPLLTLLFLLLSSGTNIFFSLNPILTGQAFNAVLLGQAGRSRLITVTLSLLVIVLVQSFSDISARLSAELLCNRVSRDARSELYLSLLSKSQTFHNRQSVGDIMARATNDMQQLNNMISPALDSIVDSFSSVATNLFFIGFLNVQLLLVPVLYIFVFAIALRLYSRQLGPVSDAMREQFGATNATLNEAVSGIEVVKATAQEAQEIKKFTRGARRYRDLYVRNGKIQGFYLPTLLLGVAIALAFLHGLYLFLHGQINIGDLIAFMGLVANLRFVTSVSTWNFSLLQLGISGSRRILSLMREETELDENERGHSGTIRGDIVFDHVTFSYGATPVLKDVSFHARPGQTIAIVGQTGSGKSTLTKLVNRIYDANEGRVLIDGVDVRDWNMDALRSQISTIEQDVFLFSRTIAENIAYGLGQQTDQEAIERAAKDAQAHTFIEQFSEGYETEIGERGVTLSGGQRQRLAIARALLTDPRILILDDSTSAIDSATEDEIQKAIRRVLQDRTTLLITHRISQIRWADSILVLRQGQLVDQGTHEELLQRCDLYRRIFAHYDSKQDSSKTA